MKVTGRPLLRFIEQLNRLGSLVSQCCLVLLLVLVFHEVIARYLFNSPTLYSVELSEYLLILLAFIAAGWVMQEDRHVRMQSFVQLLPERVQHFLACLTSCIVFLFCGVLIWYGFKASYIAWRGEYHSSSLLNMPMWIPYLIIPLGSQLLALQVIVQFCTHVDKLLTGDNR